VTRSRRAHWPPLVTCHMSLPNWCSRRDLHPHWRRSRRRASALGYVSKVNGASSRCCPGRIALQKESAGCCQEAKWSQSPVLPRTRRAYETHLSAGSTAVLTHGHQIGAPTRSCTGLARLPSERIADNALGAMKLVSLTGFAPVISCMRGRRVGWTTPQGQVERVNGVAPSSRPWHDRILLLNHTRRKLVTGRSVGERPGTLTWAFVKHSITSWLRRSARWVTPRASSSMRR
jgi:hypothetical protein